MSIAIARETDQRTPGLSLFTLVMRTVVALVLVLALIGISIPVTVLSLVGPGAETYFLARVWDGDQIEVGFTHSSEHIDVVSVFRVEDGEMVEVQTESEGFGPGLNWDEPRPAGDVLISSSGQQYLEIPFRVSSFTAHWLGVGSERVDMSGLIPPGKGSYRLTLEVDEMALLQYLSR